MTRFLTAMVKIAQEVYGEDQVSLVKHGANTTYLDIHWPEVTIRNRRGNSHIIKEMHVCLPLQADEKKFNGRIHGWRGRLSYVENRSGYGHSHLPGTNFASFCTGSDGINDVWASLQTSQDKYTDETYVNTFRGFMYLLDTFISYESLEGYPHRHIARIGLGNNNRLQAYQARQEAINILNKINRDLITLAIDFNSTSVELVETDALHYAMMKFTSHHSYRLANGTYMGLDRIGEYDEEVVTGLRAGSMAPKDYVTGKQFYPVIEAHRIEIEKIDDRKFIHPDILDNIKNGISKYGKGKLTERAIRAFEQNGHEYKADYIDQKERKIASYRKFSSSDYAMSYKKAGQGMVWQPALEVSENDRPQEAGDSNINGDLLQTAESR